MMSSAVKGKPVDEARKLIRAFKALMSIHESKLEGESEGSDLTAELEGVRFHDVGIPRVESQDDRLPRPGDDRPLQQLSLPGLDPSVEGLLRVVERDVEDGLGFVRRSLLVGVVRGVLGGPMPGARG